MAVVRSATPTMILGDPQREGVDRRRPASDGRGGRRPWRTESRPSATIGRCAMPWAPMREELDARGNTVLPGFIDAHNHLRTGADAEAVQLGDATTLDGVRAAIDRHATEHPDREWIVAEDWSYAALPDRRRPTAERSRRRRAGSGAHGLLLRRPQRLVEPRGDAAVRRRRGRANARVRPSGARRGHGRAHRVRDRLRGDGPLARRAGCPGRPGPRTSHRTSMYRRLLRSLDMAAELGITTAVEPQNSLDDLSLFRKARDEGAMRSRVVAALFHPPGTTPRSWTPSRRRRRRTTTTGSGWDRSSSTSTT